MRPSWRLSLTLLAAACSGPTTPDEPPVFTTSPAAQWSGGTVTARSAFFATSSLPTILVDDQSVDVTRVDDTTLKLRLPLGPSGPVEFEVMRLGRRESVGAVTRYGYRETLTLAAGLYGQLYSEPGPNGPQIYGSDLVTDEIIRVDLRTGLATRFPGLASPGLTSYGMSPTATPGDFVIWNRSPGATAEYELWRLDVAGVFLDSVPNAVTGPRHVGRLSDHLWLRTGHHFSATMVDSIPGPNNVIRNVQMESVWDVVPSPRGNRTAVTVNVVLINVGGNYPGIPVFVNQTGDTAFTVPISGAEATAFSTTGDRLFTVGAYALTPNRIIVQNATTGAVIAQASLPDSVAGVGLAHDPVKDLLFANVVSGNAMALRVYDPATLTLLGELPAPEICPHGIQGGNCSEGVVVVDASRREVHIVDSEGLARSFVFDLVP